MSSITTIKMLRTVDIKLIPNRFFALCIGIIMMVCANTCIAQETELFELVKNVTELQEGDTVIVVNNTNELCSALSTKWNSNKYNKTTSIDGYKIDINGETIIAPTNVDRIQLQKDSNEKWLLFSTTHKKYLCNDNKSKATGSNYIALRDKDDDLFKSTAPVEISITKYATIEFLKSTDDKVAKRILAFYYDYGSSDPNSVGYYNCYDTDIASTADRMVQLYKKVHSTPLTLNDENDNSELLTSKNGQQTAVKLSRKLLANQWNTFCVPFDIDIADGKINGIEASVMEYDHTTGNTMEFKEATKIEAGKAYLVKPSADITNPQFDKVTIKNDDPMVSGKADGYSFVGIYNPKTFSDSDQKRVLILASEAKFMRVNNGQRMKGMRAYFTIPAGTKAEAVRLMINNRPTALTEITTTPSTSEKIFYIDGTYAGSDIKNVKKGIVIKGGKKYLMK